jgi:hypothetical protein
MIIIALARVPTVHVRWFELLKLSTDRTGFEDEAFKPYGTLKSRVRPEEFFKSNATLHKKKLTELGSTISLSSKERDKSPV